MREVFSMKGTWISRHRLITIRPIVKPWTHLVSPQGDITRRPTSEGSHICLHERGSCSCTCAERISWVFLMNTWARSHEKAVEQDLLVVYPVIDNLGTICMYKLTMLFQLSSSGSMPHTDVVSNSSISLHFLSEPLSIIQSKFTY